MIDHTRLDRVLYAIAHAGITVRVDDFVIELFKEVTQERNQAGRLEEAHEEAGDLLLEARDSLPGGDPVRRRIEEWLTRRY